jgi:hypothetical protein
MDEVLRLALVQERPAGRPELTLLDHGALVHIQGRER